MSARDRAIAKAIATLEELCDVKEVDERDINFGRRQSAESILQHYRDEDFGQTLKQIQIELNVNGAIPVRPMTLAEVTP